MLAWDEIMAKSPTMKKLFEDKLKEEISKKQADIDALTIRVEQAEADNITAMLALTEVYEMILGGGI